MTYKSYVSGPRWARLGSLLQKLAIVCECQVEITHEKGWIHEDVFFKLTGDKDQINKFREILTQAIDNYNKE